MAKGHPCGSERNRATFANDDVSAPSLRLFAFMPRAEFPHPLPSKISSHSIQHALDQTDCRSPPSLALP